MSAKCPKCTKTVYESEKVRALDNDWHRWCLKCTTCNMTLSLNTLNSYDMQPYCRVHLPTATHTVIADDAATQHAKQAQSVTADANKSTQLSTQKGTGDAHTAVADDASIQHAKQAQSVTSDAHASTQLGTQKGTGDAYTSVADDAAIQHAKQAQSVTSDAHAATQLGTQKGTGDAHTAGMY